jgi:GMP synthase-like glutamine amidotransferase
MPDKILVLNPLSDEERLVKEFGKVVLKATEFMKNPSKFKMVLFTGGADISPHLYGDTSPKHICHCSAERDKMEQEIYDIALHHGILMAGICRGLQFLNVMAGGKMIHHLDRHNSVIHTMETANGEFFYVNSYHHQMILPGRNTRVIGWTDENRSKRYFGKNDNPVHYNGREIEAAIFTEINAFGVQYHPEWEDEKSYARDYYINMIADALSLPWKRFIKNYTRSHKNAGLDNVCEYNGAVAG